MMRTIQNECLHGGGRRPVSPAEALRGWVRCSFCGRDLKIRANREYEAAIPRHSTTAPAPAAAKRACKVCGRQVRSTAYVGYEEQALCWEHREQYSAE